MSDRKKPYSPEAEQQVLGCLLSRQDSVNEILAEYPRAEELFYDGRHRNIFEAIRDCGQSDVMMVSELLRNRQQLEGAGGVQFLASLLNQVVVGSPDEARRYAGILSRDFVRRRLIEAAAAMERDGYESEDAAGALENAERAVMEIGATLQSDVDPDVKTLVSEAISEMDAALTNKGIIRGLSVGFPDLDWMTHGFKEGQVIVIAARPGVGKTSLAMNMVENVAVDQRYPAGVFSLEMTGKELIHRMMCSRSRIDSQRAQSGDFQDGDFPRLTASSGKIANAPIHICEKGGLTISQLSARARRMHQRHKLKLLVIDYLQLMRSNSKGNRNEQITEISNGTKALAKDLKLPLLVLSQLNRDVDKNDREPRMSDLRDSGSIEQDADLIILLSPKEKKQDCDVQEVEALIPKHRGGRVGKIKLIFNPSLTRFESASPVSDVPTGDEPPENWHDRLP